MSSKERLRVATRRDGFTKLLSKLGKPKENHVTHVSILKLAIQMSVSIVSYIYIYFYPTEAIHQRIKVCDIVVIAG